MFRYKNSIYNLLIPVESKQEYVIWNTYSGAIVSIESDLYSLMLEKRYDSPRIKALIPDLLKEGIIVPDQLNEFNKIKFTQTQIQYDNKYNSLVLIIAPTLKCNYRCKYCFEQSHSQKIIMSEEVIKKTIGFIEQRIILNPNIKRLSISWFGGEPLIAYKEVIVPLSQQIIELCNQFKIEYSSKITTNGFYLTHENIQEMVNKLKIVSYQITFDGTCDNYCKRKGTSALAYNTVKDNLFMLSKCIKDSKLKSSISLRINIDNDNYFDSKKLVDEIKSDPRYISNISFYLGRLKGCNDYFNYSSLEEFESFEEDFSNYLEKKQRPLESKRIWCGQFAMNNLCVGPSGEIYKCEHDFGCSELVIGNVESGFYYTDYLMNYINQPTSEKCEECVLYPLCLGGCPKDRYQNKEHLNCEYTKTHLISVIQKYINERKEAK